MKIAVKLLAGLALIPITCVFFLMFIKSWNVLDMILLDWLLILAFTVSFYLAGLINRKTPIPWLGVLYLSFGSLFIFYRFYLSFFLIMFLFTIWSLCISRTAIKPLHKFYLSIPFCFWFCWMVWNQPLIIKQNGFGETTDGNMVNASILWGNGNFEKNEAKKMTLLNQDLETLEWSNFNEEKLVVTFWSQDCGPSISERQRLHTFRETFQEELKDVVFLDIALDWDRDRWREFVTQENFENQYLAKNPHYIRKLYQINGTPARFIIFNNKFKRTILSDYFIKVLSDDALLHAELKKPRTILQH